MKPLRLALPPGWRWTPLKRLASVPLVNGLGEAGDVGEPGWPRYIRTTDIRGPRELRGDVRASLSPDVASKALLTPNDLLLCSAGSLDTFHLFTADYPACFAGYLTRFRPDERKVDPRYVAYAAESAPFRWQVNAYAVRSTIDNYSAAKYANTVVSVPEDLRTQRAIADFLDGECARASDLMSELGTTSEVAMDGYAGELRRLVLEGGNRFVPLKFYAKTGTGHTPSREHPEYWVPDECVVSWFTLADVRQIRDGRRNVVTQTAEHVSETGIANSAAVKHPAGTVLLSRTASVGFSAVIGVEMAVSQDFMTWTCGPDLDPQYLLVALRAMQPELRGLMYGSTHKTIYMPDLHALRVPLPNLDEQRAIVARVQQLAEAAWPLIDEVEVVRQRLAEYRNALITETVTGQLDVSRVSDAQVDESLAAVAEGERPQALA